MTTDRAVLAVLADADFAELGLAGQALVYFQLVRSDPDARDRRRVDGHVRNLADYLQCSRGGAMKALRKLEEWGVLRLERPGIGRRTSGYVWNENWRTWRIPLRLFDGRGECDVEKHVSRVTTWISPPDLREQAVVRAPEYSRSPIVRAIERAEDPRSARPTARTTTGDDDVVRAEQRALQAPPTSLADRGSSLSLESEGAREIDRSPDGAQRLIDAVNRALPHREEFWLLDKSGGTPETQYGSRLAAVVAAWAATGRPERALHDSAIRTAAAQKKNVRVLESLERQVYAALEAPPPRPVEVLEAPAPPAPLDDAARASGLQHLAGLRNRLVPSPTPEEGAA